MGKREKNITPCQREAMWKALGADVDVLIVGGGINGAGIARDAARRGLRVAMVEMRDLAFGTSSRSSKLVHGGLRYLEQYEIGLVFESVSERRILMDLAPHLVNPLGFLFPVFKESKHNLLVIRAGMWVYDGLSLFRSPRRHRQLSAKDVAKEEPALRREGLKGAPLYFDCSTDDARLTLETAIDAARAGATIATWAKVTSFVMERGRVCGALIRDELSGEEKTVRAGVVINATGPWTDATLALAGAPTAPLLRPTKGVHIVVDAQKLPLTHAVVCFHPTDARVLFAIPWGDRTYIGTTDTDDDTDPAEVAATSEDVDYLIDAAAAYFPEHRLERGDVIATWAGLRPLITGAEGASESEVSREHRIVVGQDGLVTIAGGKLTTYRRMSAEVVDTAVRVLQLSRALATDLDPARTEKHPLPGGVGWPDDDDHDAVAAQITERAGGRLAPDIARSLADNYGMRGLEIAGLVVADPTLAERLIPGRPEIAALVDFSVREELAATVSDVLSRRTQIFYRDVDQGLGVAARVADRMAALLGWDDARRAIEVERYEAEVALSRAWRG